MFKFGSFEFDPVSGLVYRGEDETLVPPKAAGVLRVLLESPGQLVTKDELLESGWSGAFVTESSLTDAISLLRQVLGDDSRDPTYIQTLHRRGYRFIAAVERKEPGDANRGQADLIASGISPSNGDDPGARLREAGSSQAIASSRGELAPGRRLGDYEILSTLGIGAMGIVYRARDSVLEREVALKVLRGSSTEDLERGARLEREAKLVAAVSHPNIASIHSLDEADGIKFAVLELVEGKTLEEKLRNGRLEVEQSLEIGRQIAAALEAAHDSGTIHRDLKPANIKLTPGGQVKVLDFGLAQALEVSVFADDAEQSPTASLTIKGSRGAIVGTVAYMSPEQARGLPVDSQADIWSFGCVLYEMLSGRRAFGGDTITDTLVAVVDQEPDWGAVSQDTPISARTLLRRCLRKDPGRRLHAIADARIEIEETLESDQQLEPLRVAHTEESRPWRVSIPWAAAGIVVGAFLGAAGLWYSSSPSPGPVTRSSIIVEPGLRLSGGHDDEDANSFFQRPSRSSMTLSPDGKHLVYLAADEDRRQLYLRKLDRGHATPIEATEGAGDPFFSPDGQWIGFFANGLKKVPIGGGDPVTVFPDWNESYGASWGDEGTIVAAARVGGLFYGPDTGGVLEPLTTLDTDRGETSHRLPHILPGSKAVLYTVLKGFDWENAEIVVQELDGGEPRTLILGGTDARYVSTGHLVFAREGVLMAVGFDPERLEISGEPVTIIDEVQHGIRAGNGPLNSGAAQVAVSETGTLVYAAGGVYPEVLRSLFRIDQNGESHPFDLPERRYYKVRLSPDGEQLAYAAGPGRTYDIHTYDVEQDVGMRLTTTGLENSNPVWSPDSKWIAFESNRDGSVFNIYVMAADGTGDPRRLTTSDRGQSLSSWSASGVLAFIQNDDIWLLPDPMNPASEPRPFFETRFKEWYPTFSPDGRWLAYMSDESGQFEVYVRPYPGPDPATPITGGRRGGNLFSPAWSRDGQELYYRVGSRDRNKILAVELSGGQTLEVGSTRVVFDLEPGAGGTRPVRAYDVAPDGSFIMISNPLPRPQPVTQLNLVLNWFEELTERVPTGR